MSVTVKVTVLAPKFEQSKEVLLNTTLAIPQLSVEPLLMSAAVILAVPFASNCMVLFWTNTIGATLSCTVTIASALEELLEASVTVKVTVLAPTFEQSNEDLLNPRVAIPTLSVEPLSTWDGVMFTLPLASNCTVIFFVTVTGAVWSVAVTVKVCVE